MKAEARIAADIIASAAAYEDGVLSHAAMAARIRSSWTEAERLGRAGYVERILRAHGFDALGKAIRSHKRIVRPASAHRVRCVHGGGGSTMAILDNQHAEGTAKPMPRSGSKDVVVKVEKVSYPVKGASKEAILDSIQKNGPARDGEHFVAYTDWTIAWDFDLDRSGKGRVVDPKVGVKVKVELPEWSPPPGASPDLVANWKRARAAIEKHEADHASLALLAGHRVLDKLKSLPAVAKGDRAAVDKAACEVIEKVKAAEVAHDEKTEHGLTQGTYL